ncbi:MAG: hypothetical protein ACTSRS_17240 [Candidatus Helarchaeota archaeon]
MKAQYVVTTILKNLAENPFQTFNKISNKIWESFLENEDTPYAPYISDYEEIEFSKKFPMTHDLNFLCLQQLMSFESLDELVKRLPQFFDREKTDVEEIQSIFKEIRKDILRLLKQLFADDQNNAELTQKSFLELLKKVPKKKLGEEFDEIYENLTENLNDLKEDLLKLLLPIYFILKEQFLKLGNGLKLQDYEEGDISHLDLEKLSKIRFEITEPISERIVKYENLEKMVIRILKSLLKYYCHLFYRNIWNQQYFIDLKRGLAAIDALNTVFRGMGWDLTSGVLKNIAIDKILEYSTLLEKVPEILKIAEQIGRFEGSWATKEKWILSPFVSQEIYNIRRSNDIQRALVGELGKLGHPILKKLFMARYIDHSLLTYDLRGKEKLTYKEKEEKKRGPIIACIDTSGSMSGYPEELAKALSLAIIKIAQHEKRDVHIILFSGPSQFKEMSFKMDIFQKQKYDSKMDYESFLRKQEEYLNRKRTYYSQVIDLLSFSFGGGTDFRTPLKEARKMLSTPEFQKADILFVSDGISFVDQIVREITEEIKSNNARIFTVVIGQETTIVREFSDYLYVLSPKIISRRTQLDTKMGKLLKQITLPKANQI